MFVRSSRSLVGIGFILPVLLSQAAPAQEPTRRPRVVAVIATVERYEDGRIPGSPGATAAARALQRWLIDTAGATTDNVLLMDGESQRQPGGDPRARIESLYPSKTNLDWALRSWLPARLGPGDLAFVCLSMQSAAVPPRPTDPPETRPSVRLVPIDAHGDDLDRTGWRVESALDPIASSGANPVLVWLDTAPEGRRVAVRAGQPAISPDLWLNTIARWPAVSVWLAGSGRPLADDVTPSFLRAARDAMGTENSRRSLMAALDHLRSDPRRADAGFRTAGRLPVEATLWQADLAALPVEPGELVLQRGHSDRVLDLVATPDGAWYASAGADSTIKLWRASDRALWQTLTHHSVGVTHLALPPDGRRLASGDGAGRVWFWRFPGLRAIPSQPIRPHDGEVTTLQFLDDGRHALSLDASGRALLWTLDDNTATARTLAEGVSGAVADEGRVALALPDDSGSATLRLCKLDGQPLRTLPAPGGIVTHRTLALSGDVLAVADTEGHLGLWNPENGDRLAQVDLGEPLTALALAADRLVAIVGGTLRVLDPARPREIHTISTPGPLDRLVLAPDGRTVAATSQDGRLFSWDLSELPGRSRSLDASETVVASAVALVPGQALLAGGQDGSLRAWDLPDGTARPAVTPHRTQVAGLAVDDAPRFLLQITRDRRALAWDLEEGRALMAIPGLWTAATHLPGSDRFALLDRAGDVHLFESGRWAEQDVCFERARKIDGDQQELHVAFDRIVASADGRRIAASATHTPVVAVWDAKLGRLLGTVRPPVAGTTAMALSHDGTRLFTAGEDGAAWIWTLAPEGPFAPVATTLVAPGTADASPITAVALLPGTPQRVVTGHQDGSVWLRTERESDSPIAQRLDRLDGAVHALQIIGDGGWLAIAGDDKAVRMLPLGGDRIGEPIRLEPSHAERVTSLVTLGNAPVLASGSEDGTIRFWHAGNRRPLGTLVATDANASWLAFAPDGRWDGSPGALNQLAWRREGRLLALDQFGERFHAFRLLDTLRRGEELPPMTAYRLAPGPALALDALPAATARRDITLSLTMNDPNASQIRLYLNGIPIHVDDPDAPPTADATLTRSLNATLRHGTNTIYAMAAGASPDSIEGRSNTVTIRCDAPDRPGRLHILAMGVDRYPNRPLKFSTADARSLSGYLSQNPADAASRPDDTGRVTVLLDDEISEAAVRKALSGIREIARPEDTVVVFLAGHTDVRLDPTGRERFCLLLPTFPFPGPPPGTQVAMRGPAPAAKAADPAGTVLPYSLIYQYLARMDARQRVVILDACQAAAAPDDPAVRRIRENVARHLDAQAQEVRTSYLLASRRDEPALEVESLRHGLMTYLLLKGMGASGLPELPDLDIPTADADADGLITTAELGTFVAARLPALAERFAPGTLRAGADAPRDAGSSTGPISVTEATTAAFPLVRIPAGSR